MFVPLAHAKLSKLHPACETHTQFRHLDEGRINYACLLPESLGEKNHKLQILMFTIITIRHHLKSC